MMTAPDGRALFVKRSGTGDHAGEWCFPGGGVEADESYHDAAKREAAEETGVDPKHLAEMDENPIHEALSGESVNFATYHHRLPEPFVPTLDDEHDDYTWAHLNQAPQPLHPGVKATLDRIVDNGATDEGGVKSLKLKFFNDEDDGQAGDAETKHDPSTGQFTSGGGGSHPATLSHKGKTYSATGKVGKHIGSGEHSAEYTHHSDYGKPGNVESRLWHRKSGVTEDAVECVADDLSEKDTAHGKLSERQEAAIGTVGSEKRDEMPASVFLMPASRKYPVKEKSDGEWKYTRKMLLAAARRARMNGNESLANRADSIREREFGAGEGEDECTATDSALRLALDRDSVRQKDKDGRLHIAVANICKACISPYKGDEIPGYKELGLDPDKIYQMLRPPEELEKATPSVNGVQILRKHIPVSVDDHKPWDVAGAVGTTATFDDPYIKNGLTIWAADDINGIESGEKRELSPGYHYKPIMEPGKFNGEPYDGRMTDIVFNHLALVEDGRQGTDIIVGDNSVELQWAIIEDALTELMTNA